MSRWNPSACVALVEAGDTAAHAMVIEGPGPEDAEAIRRIKTSMNWVSLAGTFFDAPDVSSAGADA